MKRTGLIALMLTAVMLVGLLAVFPASAVSAAWDGNSIARPAGEGTKEKPFLIASAENLAWLSHMTENYAELNELLGTSFASSEVFKGMYFVQTADIDLGGKTFRPIGFTQSSDAQLRNAFAGRYDGGHYQIANATVVPDAAADLFSYDDCMQRGYHPGGIFGVLANRASISNVFACNVQSGTLDQKTLSKRRAYSTPVAGVIVGTTYGMATVSGCVTDADCKAYGYFAAGGIMGMPDGSAQITQCINRATVSSCEATGGIIGYGFNAEISYCVNSGKVQHYTFTPWTGVGGIMGSLFADSRNESNSISDCINAPDAEVSSVSLQPEESGPNRVAIGGIMGTDDFYLNANITYENCYNLQERFFSFFRDNDNLSAGCLTLCGGITGYSKHIGTVKSVRSYDNCFSLASDCVNDVIGKQTVYACNFDSQANNGAGAVNPERYSGLITATLSAAQIKNGVGDPQTAFATCAYGVSSDSLLAKSDYQAILAATDPMKGYCEAPKYAGVQETLDRGEKYALRWILTVSHAGHHQDGIELVATYEDGTTETHRLVGDKYFDTVLGTVNGVVKPYTAAELGGSKVMALTHKVDLATRGAASYRITPFFIANEGDEATYGRTWTVSYADDGTFLSQKIQALTSLGDVTSLYGIVYPTDSHNAPVYAAVALQNHVFTRLGIKLPLSGERSAYSDDYEIVIEEDSSLDTGRFITTVQDNRLIVRASDMFGYVAAANCLVNTIFPTGNIVLNDACNQSGTYTNEMLTEKTGEMRVIFQNAWYRDNGPHKGGLFDSVTGYDYQLALAMSYRPDVIGFSEFWEGWRASGFVEAMAQNGYVEAKPGVPGSYLSLGNPIFYNSETTEYVEHSARYISYGKYDSVDTDGNGLPEPILRTSGAFAGRYYDNSDNTSSTALVATFRDKETQKTYSVCCTHLESNAFVDPQIPPLGNPLRWEQAEKLIAFLKNYQAEYGTTVILGGDLNSQDSYSPGNYSANGQTVRFDGSELFDYYDGRKIPYLYAACDMLRENGFINCREDTANTAYNSSCHGYPIWSNDLKAYVGYQAQTTNDPNQNHYRSSIDHIYALEISTGCMETLIYRNLAPEPILCSSDHKPVMIDFNLK